MSGGFSCLSNRDIEDLKAPPCQRLVDPIYVQALYAFQKMQKRKYGDFFFPLPVVIAQLESIKYVVDGQHRIACVQRLLQEGEKADLIRVVTMEALEEKYDA